MSSEKGKATVVGAEAAAGGKTPRSVELASRGVGTAQEAANFLSALLTDVMTSDVSEKKANAACNTMGKMLKVVDMQHKYGGTPDGVEVRPLKLADTGTAPKPAVNPRREELLRELAELEARERASA